MTNGVGRSYKYYTGTPLFPFGFGLSYTTFDIKWATPPPASTHFGSLDDSEMVYTVTVTNTGAIAGDEVVLAYTEPKAHTLRASLGPSVPIEKRKLFGFQRVSVRAGGSATLNFTLTPSQLAMVDENGHTSMHNGDFGIVFSRGHGRELITEAKVALTQQGLASRRLKTFRKWW